MFASSVLTLSLPRLLDEFGCGFRLFVTCWSTNQQPSLCNTRTNLSAATVVVWHRCDIAMPLHRQLVVVINLRQRAAIDENGSG